MYCRRLNKQVILLCISQALQDARIKTTETLVAMEEEDDFDDPLTPIPVKGQLWNPINVILLTLLMSENPQMLCSVVFQL